ncbi:MAG: Dna2/Cas4 domain-containing protein [Thermoplasmata archaeon]|nr:Dna2/Cas4 domain-containing protein [Thermoplasmata archaeon]
MQARNQGNVMRISAADIEKFTYCPLSWKLSYSDRDAENKSQMAGKKQHRKFGRKVKQIIKAEQRTAEAEVLIFTGGVVSTIVALSGAIIYSPLQNFIVSRISLIVGLIWFGVAVFFLYLSAFFAVRGLRLVLLTGILAGILFLISTFTYAFQNPYIGLIFEPVALVWLIFTSVFFFIGERQHLKAMKMREEMEFGKEEIVIPDQNSPMVTRDGKLSGTPDLILKSGETLIPVEIKTGRVPRGPHFSHIMQLIAYCYIIEDLRGKPPPYGILRYGSTDFEIEYTPELKNLLERKMEEMRQALSGEMEVHRNHSRAGKCRNCSRRKICPERLVH